MKKITYILVIIFLSLIQNTFGQNDCNTNSIVGEWKMIGFDYGIHTNADCIMINYQQDTSFTNTIQFKNDNTCEFKNVNGKRSKRYYFVDTEKCEIIIYRNKNQLENEEYRERFNWEIIYMDNEKIIYKEDNNPKSYMTHILLKK